MRTTKVITLMILLLSFAAIGTAGQVDSWVAAIVAESQNVGEVARYEAYFGVGDKTIQLDAPPPPPEYSVKMELMAPNGGLYSKDIRGSGNSEYLWVIAIDPSGNLNTPEARMATLRWDTSKLGQGSFSLVDGYNGMGVTLVDDMKAVSSYEVTGANIKYFSIVFKPY